MLFGLSVVFALVPATAVRSGGPPGAKPEVTVYKSPT